MHATTHFPPVGGPGAAPDVAQAWRSLQAPGAAADHPDPEVARVFASLVQPGETELEAVIRGSGPEAWAASDRARLLVRLLQRFNKVTHLYELLKCSGHSQVMKTDGHWRRRPALELKHSREDSVNPVTGGYGPGAGHAPLIYARDPRADLPAELEARLTAVLQGADERIILGWVAAAGLT
jgi:hypothetical protein